ncbi:DUF2007 domain-containing protein [uncultured Draconibacterium sp.]|uniref:putative signal transducing protein n=1 Tax=uncultured Draconibacterium sp. TaxID=1573823 RepID=UPI003217DDD6
MTDYDGLIKLFTGGDVIIARIKQELELEGINSLVKDRFKQGLAAGYGDGVPSAIDLFVTEEDYDKAIQIVKALTEE